MTIGWRTGGQRFLVVSHAVFIEERLIDQILGDHPPTRGLKPVPHRSQDESGSIHSRPAPVSV
ncbi:hypothetical protein MJ585_10090 [Klebsiella pneumoniae]|nr:hypothetical protein MJ585_10090 [Klebsiella pneumoniae]